MRPFLSKYAWRAERRARPQRVKAAMCRIASVTEPRGDLNQLLPERSGSGWSSREALPDQSVESYTGGRRSYDRE